ncbi:hypothetical protein HDV04_000906 [Boothiomyces sp. JEL0838]|nr:hypothetical protein HDV04_000857 [Boothiomyces sp. JEL0838]KAJ3314183.1 hypothetical protein HDV04_000906 [Boothiomyces sp. JEL0838]
MKGKNTILNIKNHFKYKLKSHQLQDMEIGKIRLSNGLNAVLISDKNTPITSAALSVDAGSWHDGRYEGTAHFLEHMLFLGTKKYPSESEYKRYISDANGSLNGYTANDHSLYYFQNINPNKLVGALDRFSRFFYEPLFNENCVEREMIGKIGLISAVDEEYKKNILSDGWRALHVRKELSNPDHPFAGFNTGNLETMKLIDQQYLKNWFSTHYNSNLMNLVVVGKEPIAELQGIVNEQFSPIIKGSSTNRLQKMELFPDLKGKVVWIEPLKNLKELSIVWEIPFEYCDITSKPASLLSFVLGHEGEHSLLSSLKKLDLVEGITAGQQIVGQKNVLYEISVMLTEKGLVRWKSVVEKVMSAIESLKTCDFPKYIYTERNLMSKIAYEYQQRSPTIATSYAKAMRRESLETFPMYSFNIDRFDEVAIKNLLYSLTVDKAFIEIMANNSPHTLDRKEKWMGAKYTVFSYNNTIAQPTPNEVKYPKPNTLVPTKLDVLVHPAIQAIPTKIYENNVKLLLEEVLLVLKNPELSESKFGLFKASLSRRYNNYVKNSPLQQANESFYKLVIDQYVTGEELAHALENISLNDLQDFTERIYEKRIIEAFAGGNCTQSESLEMLKLVLSRLEGNQCDPLAVTDAKLLPYNETVIKPINLQVNGNAVVWSQYVGKKSDRVRCDWEIFSKLIKEPFYSSLRTQQQTGYIVSSGAIQIDKQFLLTAYIQSNTYSAQDLYDRIEDFHNDFLLNIDTDVNRHRFGNRNSNLESIRESCLKRLRSPFDQLSAKNDYYYHMAFKENQDFGALQRRIAIFEGYQFADVIEFAQKLLRDNKKSSILASGKE